MNKYSKENKMSSSLIKTEEVQRTVILRQLYDYLQLNQVDFSKLLTPKEGVIILGYDLDGSLKAKTSGGQVLILLTSEEGGEPILDPKK